MEKILAVRHEVEQAEKALEAAMAEKNQILAKMQLVTEEMLALANQMLKVSADFQALGKANQAAQARRNELRVEQVKAEEKVRQAEIRLDACETELLKLKMTRRSA